MLVTFVFKCLHYSSGGLKWSYLNSLLMMQIIFEYIGFGVTVQGLYRTEKKKDVNNNIGYCY